MVHSIPTAALFPGQGAQHAGMNKELLAEFPWTRTLFEEASDTLHFNLTKLCLDGPDSELQLTQNAQPAILTTSFAWFEVIRKNTDWLPTAAAGHSLGEYTALLSAGALGLSQAVRLVRRRGELMQTAVPVGQGKMAAILGLADEGVRALCEHATTGEDSLVVPANYNSPGQVVIAGHATAVDRAIALTTNPKTPQFKTRRALELKVSAPFHCPLMKPVAQAFTEDLEKVPWKNRRFNVVHNLDAQERTDGSLVELLRDQIDHPVLWTQCQQRLHALGARHYVEMGPAKVLSGLGKRICTDSQFHSVESVEGFRKFEAFLKEARP